MNLLPIDQSRSDQALSETKLKILVTGAAGRHGATGRRVTEMLLKRGFSVRAFVRIEDERSEQLQKLGAEIVSKVFNRPVEYVPVSIEKWQENFIKVVGKNPYLLQHLSSILSLFANLRLKTGIEARRLSVQQIRAQSPLSFEEFLETKRVSLGAPPSLGQTA
jgi:hypothetical protein